MPDSLPRPRGRVVERRLKLFTSTRGRRVALALAVALVLIAGMTATRPRAASAYTDTFYSYDTLPPNLYFSRGGSINQSTGAIMGTLTAYVTYDGYRHRITMAAGSGNGTLNDCTSNAGPAPDGYYGRSDGDSNSDLVFEDKEWGGTVIRGWVWYMRNKRCDGGSSTLRTALYIHSQGYTGWQDSNYASLGCVKVNQTDRSWLSTVYRISYQYWNDRLHVCGNEV